MLDYRAHTFIIAYRLRSFTRAAEEPAAFRYGKRRSAYHR